MLEQPSTTRAQAHEGKSSRLSSRQGVPGGVLWHLRLGRPATPATAAAAALLTLAPWLRCWHRSRWAADTSTAASDG